VLGHALQNRLERAAIATRQTSVLWRPIDAQFALSPMTGYEPFRKDHARSSKTEAARSARREQALLTCPGETSCAGISEMRLEVDIETTNPDDGIGHRPRRRSRSCRGDAGKCLEPPRGDAFQQDAHVSRRNQRRSTEAPGR
jgi:hypothetical protein